MKTISKYCQAILFPLLLSSTFVASAEPQSSTKQVADQTQQGKLIWADLYTGDVNASIDFYTKTFGWSAKKFDKAHERYHLLYEGDQPVAGVIERPTHRNKTENSLWIGSISTTNIQENIDNAAKGNATIILQPHDFALYGQRAVFADPQGGIIALLDIYANKKAQPKISSKWNWAQLFSINPQKAADFYQSTFNYGIEKVEEQAESFYLIQQEKVRASIVKLPEEYEQRDRWVNFIEVTELNQTLTAAIKNGAKVIYQPEGDTFAIIADPHGALLGLAEEGTE